jgi:hypothetical protein
VRRTVPPTTTVQVQRALWIASLLIGLGAVLVSFLTRADAIEALADVFADASDREASTLETASTVAFWGTWAGIVVVVVLEALLVQSMLMGRRGALRWVLVPVVLLHAVVAGLAELLIAGGEGGVWTSVLLAGQLLLAGAALVAGLLPGATRWFRARADADDGTPA